MSHRRAPKVLILSRNYPNHVMPHLGLWVEGLARQIGKLWEARVVAPVPYCPPFPGGGSYTRYRRILRHERVNNIEVWRPPFLTGPGYSLHSVEAFSYYWSIRHQVARIHREFPFELIHAHFTYPDGVVAARLGERYRVPVLITEHAPWLPWMAKYPRVRSQAVCASERCAFHIAVSRYVRDTIGQCTGAAEKVRIVPVGVDGSVFRLPGDGEARDPNRILYVGRIHSIKGVDILLRAMRQLIDRRPGTRLMLVGGGLVFRDYRMQEEHLRSLAGELGLKDCVEFAGAMTPQEVAQLMRASALIVLPSRAESFGAVLVEALACGTPVVAARCGGPEDIVNDDVGVLVPKEDPDALAAAIEYVLERRGQYDSVRLRAYALENFAWEQIAGQTVDLYYQALDGFRGRRMHGAVERLRT